MNNFKRHGTCQVLDEPKTTAKEKTKIKLNRCCLFLATARECEPFSHTLPISVYVNERLVFHILSVFTELLIDLSKRHSISHQLQ